MYYHRILQLHIIQVASFQYRFTNRCIACIYVTWTEPLNLMGWQWMIDIFIRLMFFLSVLQFNPCHCCYCDRETMLERCTVWVLPTCYSNSSQGHAISWSGWPRHHGTLMMQKTWRRHGCYSPTSTSKMLNMTWQLRCSIESLHLTRYWEFTHAVSCNGWWATLP